MITVLLGLDQGVKWLIFSQFNHLMNVETYISPYFSIYPVFNDQINGINALWDIGITRNVYILGTITLLLIYIYLYSHCQADVRKGDQDKKKWITFILVSIAGMLGALWDKFFWGNSLDFLGLGGWIFDFKDIYIGIGFIGLGILVFLYIIKHRADLKTELQEILSISRYTSKK